MSDPIKAIIFDVGGVLVHTEDPAPRRRLAAQMGLPLNTLYTIVFGGETWHQAQTGRISPDLHWQAVGRRLGLARPEAVNDFRRDFFSGDRLDRELLDALLRWRSRYKTALLSNAVTDLRRWIAQDWQVPDDAFDAIVISAEEGIMKPDPAIYHIALSRLDVAPQEAVFVDDFIENVEAAAALGMRAVHHVGRERTLAQLQGLLAPNPPAMSISPPLPQDYRGLLAVSQTVEEEDWWGAALMLTQPETTADVAALCDDPENLVQIASIDGQVAGVGLLLQPEPAVLHHTAEISIAVHPAHRRRGVARQIIENLLADGAEQGVELVRAWVAAENGASRALMQRLGFHEMARLADELQRADGQRFDVIVYTRNLRHG
ncbi:MAG: HAD-IA family hydrolase [Chloroflexota bacterium]